MSNQDLELDEGWTAQDSTPEDGQCDGCGGDLYEVETMLFINADGDAFCYGCYMNPEA